MTDEERQAPDQVEGAEVDEEVVEYVFDEDEFELVDLDELGELDDVEVILDSDARDSTLVVVERGDRVSYETSDWSGASRALLDAMLASDEVQHLWQGTEVTVPVSERDRVEEIIGEVLATGVPALDLDRAKVVYEVGEWPAAMQTGLAESLVVADIAYEWNESGDLVVYEEDEERVDQIIDAIPDPDDADRVEVDGLEVQDLLSSLFVATGELARRPTDAHAVLAVVDDGARLEAMAVPFGFDDADWARLVDRVVRLRAALDPDDDTEELDDDELREQAGELRALLRTYV